ncbi:putative bifunctional diguanylate cyclase/phosphodiesterase [Deinococcus planocerae]|uniref:putative bifunctional diguanylate cyclase/phosphodiesterase n=1 Tax=Deinococcus planocerae TaxID=1737569 RepID=UPI000C7F3838|nr:EAL domain-containing protein [Deinococcus planocerae]
MFMPPGTRPSRLALALLAVVFAHLAWFVWPGHGGAFDRWLAETFYIPAFLLGAALCWRAGTRAGPEARPAWRAFGVGLAAFGVGQVVWTYLELVRQASPFPSVADVLFLSLPVAFALAFRRLPRAPLSRGAAVQLALDVALVTGSAALFSWRFLFTDVLTTYTGQPLALWVAFAYPALDLLLLALALLLVARQGGAPRRAAGLLALGLAALIVADSGFAYLSLQNVYRAGAWPDLFWSLGAALVGLASLGATPGPHPSPRTSEEARAWPLALTPYLAVVAATFLQLSTFGERGPEAWGVLVGGALLTLLVILRQGLAFAGNERLTRRLRALSGELETRVAERTAELRRQGGALDAANAELRALSAALETQVRERTAALEASHAQLAHLAQHDALTGLPNRALLEDRLTRATAHAARHGGLLAVLFVDLDGFKFVNDTLGHRPGDEVLTEVARRLTGAVRGCDTVARFGGDEFVVLLHDLAREEDAAAIAGRMLATFAQPFALSEHEVRVTASVGVSLSPRDGVEPAELLRHADVAMYQAKRHGKNAVRFFSPEMNAAARARADLETSLRGALARGEFALHYQPQFGPGGEVCGFEALLRWTHPDLGPVSPATFVGVAEDAGLIVPIGTWVLGEACRQNAAWQREGLPPVRVAVNVSPAQFAREDFVSVVRAALQGHGLEGRWLEVELTERLVVQDVEATARKMAELRALGVGVSVDDFGAGHSALAYLLRLPVSGLKIDRAFVRDLGEVPGAERVVGAIVALAHALGLEVVAEGVETAAQLRRLHALDCERTQGFLQGRPAPAAEARERLVAASGWAAVTGPLGR